MIDETFDYKGYHVQRMTKDCLWYVTFENKIVYWHQYRNDIKSWIDTRTPIVQQSLSGSDDKSSSPKSCYNCRNERKGCGWTDGDLLCNLWKPKDA